MEICPDANETELRSKVKIRDFMMSTYSVDALIRAGLREEVAGQEPSPSVRDSLLIAVKHENKQRSTLGPAIPSLVRGLQDTDARSEALQHWWETRRSHRNDFSVWDNPWQTPGLVHVMVYYDARRCRFERVTC
jgi:hypothetical protein